jgi:Membrane domain of glycerophosphoryl diester phosphodiesterase
MASAAAPISRFDLGRVVERTFSSISRNFPVFLLLTLLLAGVPALLTGLLLYLAGIGAAGGAGAAANANLSQLFTLGAAGGGFTALVGAIASFILQAAVVYGTIADLNGRRAVFSECLSTGLRSWFWIFLLAIVVGLAEVLGFILFIVPGVMMAVAWIVAVPALVVERTGVFGAMSRSAELTRGHRWPIFGLLVIYIIAAGVISSMVSAVVGAAAASVSTAATQPTLQLVAQPLVSVITKLISSAGVASIYFELRSTREGIGPEALAAVFD